VLKLKKQKPVTLQIYDYAQMFDSIDLEEALSDLYDVGVDDDTLALLYQANAEVYMALKTPAGLTDRRQFEILSYRGTLLGLYWHPYKWIILEKKV
jgi:hypothetical protein